MFPQDTPNRMLRLVFSILAGTALLIGMLADCSGEPASAPASETTARD